MAADPLSRVFSALADPTRRDIVARLAVGDATVNELAAPYDVTVQAVSKHLKVLEDAGLVSRSREAQRRPVHLEANVFDLMTKWIERYRQQAEERYRRLDDVLRAHAGRSPLTQGRNTVMTSTTHHETQIVADPDVPLVRIVREFDAPVEKVFRAHVDPDLVVQWLGPRDLTMTIDHFDCRTGGSYRYIHSRDGEDYGFHGSFHEVRPERADRADLHLRGLPRPGRPGEAASSRTSATAAPG